MKSSASAPSTAEVASRHSTRFSERLALMRCMTKAGMAAGFLIQKLVGDVEPMKGGSERNVVYDKRWRETWVWAPNVVQDHKPKHQVASIPWKESSKPS